MILRYFYFSPRGSILTFLYASRFCARPEAIKEYRYLKVMLESDLVDRIGYTTDIFTLDYYNQYCIQGAEQIVRDNALARSLRLHNNTELIKN